MLIIRKNEVNNMIATVSMNKTLPNPYYLFSFQHIASKERISFYPQVITSNVRYDKFRFVEAPTTVLTGLTPQVNFEYLGQYYYSIYENITSGSTNIALAYNKLESGRAWVIVGDDNSQECFFEPYISNDEDFAQVIYVSEEEQECQQPSPSPTPSITPTLTPSPTCPTNSQFFMTGFLSGTDLQIFLEETLTNVAYNATCPFDFSLTLVRDDDATSAFTTTFTANTDNQTFDISGFLGINGLKSIIYNSITLDPSCSCVSAKVYNYYRVNRCSDGAFVGSVFTESGGTYVNSVRKLIQNGQCRTITNTLRDQVGFPNAYEWQYSTPYIDCNECLLPPSPTPTTTSTPTPTSTCGTFTTQYVKGEILPNGVVIRGSLWNDSGFTSSTTAICQYDALFSFTGSMGTVVVNQPENFLTGEHNDVYNASSQLQPMETLVNVVINSVIPQCPCVSIILPT